MKATDDLIIPIREEGEEIVLDVDGYDLHRFIRGRTLDRGRIAFGRRLLCGSADWGLWSGRQMAPRERPVLITYSQRRYYPSAAQNQRLRDRTIRYDIPGIAPLVFYGSPDGSIEPTPEDFARAPGRVLFRESVVVEVQPDGTHLIEAGRLNRAEVIRLGLGLCDVLLAWRAPALIVGLRPETVYVAGEPGNRSFSGATPRAFVELGGWRRPPVFSLEVYESPTDSVYDRNPDEWVYTVALLLWFALLGEHAFLFGTQQNEDLNMRNDIRASFTGPPELGRLLEAVLVADVEKRMKAPELREELAKLAARWNVEPPPFPPPGLA